MLHLSGTVTRRPSDEPETIAELHSAPLHRHVTSFSLLSENFCFLFVFLILYDAHWIRTKPMTRENDENQITPILIQILIEKQRNTNDPFSTFLPISIP